MQKYGYQRDLDTLKSIDIRALGYFRNTEFFHPMEQGRTQFGLQLNIFWKSKAGPACWQSYRATRRSLLL